MQAAAKSTQGQLASVSAARGLTPTWYLASSYQQQQQFICCIGIINDDVWVKM